MIVGAVAAEGEKSGLVVHEWGVLTRKNTFPETVGAAEALLESLPGFVGRHAGYKPEQMFRPWTKPVLHFYGKEQKIAVDILTPTGRPVAYWPMPMLLEETFWIMGDGLRDAVGMRWEGKLTKEKPGNIKEVSEGHWWAKIREVGGLWLETSEASERFLFYEGTGISDPAVMGRIEGDVLLLENRNAEESGRVLVIMNDGEERFLGAVDKIAAGGVVELKKADLMGKPVAREALEKAAEQQWLSFGMTEEEATMIVSVWADDLWENRGFLVVSRMPPKIYDAHVFPIDIEPKPDELVRAAVIFDTMPGVAGRVGWLPKLRPQILELLGGLGSANPLVREKATSGIAMYGDLAREVLEEVAGEGDIESKMRVKRLLGKLDRKPASNLPTHGKGGVREPKVVNEGRFGPLTEIEGKIVIGEERGLYLEHEDYGKIQVLDFRPPDGDLGKTMKLKGRFVPPGYADWQRLPEGSPWALKVEQ